MEWSEECTRAFEDLKKYLAVPPVLSKPRPGEGHVPIGIRGRRQFRPAKRRDRNSEASIRSEQNTQGRRVKIFYYRKICAVEEIWLKD